LGIETVVQFEEPAPGRAAERGPAGRKEAVGAETSWAGISARVRRNVDL